MITAHIRSPFGDRTEEWEDYQVDKERARYVVDFHVYVLGYDDGTGKEATGIVPKNYWEIIDEVEAFAFDEPGEQPQVTKFADDTLQGLGNLFKVYLDIEKAAISGANLSPEECDTMLKTVKTARAANNQFYDDLVPVLDPINKREQTGELKLATRGLLQSMLDFSNAFHENILAMQTVLEGLQKRNQGGNYSPLDYVRDVNVLKQQAEQRHAPERSLTKYRSAFKEVLSRND